MCGCALNHSPSITLLGAIRDGSCPTRRHERCSDTSYKPTSLFFATPPPFIPISFLEHYFAVRSPQGNSSLPLPVPLFFVPTLRLWPALSPSPTDKSSRSPHPLLLLILLPSLLASNTHTVVTLRGVAGESLLILSYSRVIIYCLCASLHEGVFPVCLPPSFRSS